MTLQIVNLRRNRVARDVLVMAEQMQPYYADRVKIVPHILFYFYLLVTTRE